MRAEITELRRVFPLDWDMRRSYRLPSDDVGQPYYIRWSAADEPVGEGWDRAQFDADGVLLTEGAPRPVATAQYALTEYEKALAGDTAAERRFFAQVRYLLKSQRSDGAYVHEGLHVPWYRVPNQFISAQAQGEAASVLLRAYARTSDIAYFECALRALQPLLHDVRDGGVSYIRGDEFFFEEIAQFDPCHILNGHLYAAFALWEFIRFGLVGSDFVEAHEAAMRTCERWLPYYDADGWSCYDLAVDDRDHRHYANLWYHQFHIAQLRVYAVMTCRPAFSDMAERWYRALSRLDVRARVWRYGVRSAARAVRRRLLRRPFSPFEPSPAFNKDPGRSTRSSSSSVQGSR